jgi:ketosteroid isomerase-like protein
MKLLTPLLAITLVAFAVAPCARAQDNSAIETRLKQMEDAWVKALMDKDQAAVGNMVAEDFAGINPKGEHQNKTQLLENIKKETDTFSSVVNDKLDVQIYGPNLATVIGTTTEKGKGKGGKEFTRSYAWVDTWMERNGKWECIGEAVVQLSKKK